MIEYELAMVPVFFRTDLSRSLGLTPGDAVNDAVWVNCEKGATIEIEAHLPGIWTKGWMFDNCASVIWLGMTPNRWLSEKVASINGSRYLAKLL